MIKKLKYNLGSIYYKFRYFLYYFKRKSITIRNNWDTVNFIIEHKCSVSRYGDGELFMIFNFLDKTTINCSGFQKVDYTLCERLFQILHEGNQINHNFYIGLPGSMFSVGVKNLIKSAGRFWQASTNKFLKRTLPLLKKDTYLDSLFTRFYMFIKDKQTSPIYIKLLRKIWDNRELLVIEGEQTRLGVGNDLFDNSKRVQRILCPPTNAWNKYDNILLKIREVASPLDDKLILCALGMTATVLAHDLAFLGYQAIDIGHIDIEYEWMLRNAKHKIAIPGKFTNEVVDGNKTSVCFDEKYISQIIHIIK